MASKNSPLAPLEVEDPDEQVINTGDVDARREAQLDARARRNQMNRVERQTAAFAKQERVSLRVPEDTTVMINGVGFYIKGKETVKVPEQVYDELVRAGRI